MKKYLILAAIVAVVFVSGCTATDNGTTPPTNGGDGGTTGGGSNGDGTGNGGTDGGMDIATFTLAEVAAHSTQGDCWLAINGMVYDVTSFIATHPGGEAILEGCGKDATSLFNERTREDGSTVGSGTPHSSNARSQLESFYIGDLAAA
jgi:cytochrome b involved in lipid metabolism